MAQSLPQTPPNSSDSARPPRKFNPRLLVVGVGAIALVGYGGWQWLSSRSDSGKLAVSGRIEADETDIQAKNGGQILAVNVREGDEVKAGQVLAQIKSDDLQAQVRRSESDVQSAQERVAQAQANLLSAQQQVDRAQAVVAQLDNQIREAQLNFQQSQGDSSGQINQATAQVSAAQAQVVSAQAQVQQAESDLRLAQITRDRYAKLVTEGAIGQQVFDQYQTAAETAQAALQARIASVKAAQDQLNAARGGLTQAQTKSLNPEIRNAQVAALMQQREQANAQLRVAQSTVQSAQAQLKEAQANFKSIQAAQKSAQATLAYNTLTSPIDGVVLERLLEPGAVVTPQKTILTLINPKEIYLRGYVPEGDIGKIHVGMKAKVILDSNSKQPLEARVTAIDPKASFTPENIYFKRDRVRQVFGVKLTIDQTTGLAKPGMPADAEILLQE